MNSITTFEQLTAHLQNNKQRKRVVIVCGRDEASKIAATKALQEGIADFIYIDNIKYKDQNHKIEGYEDHIQRIFLADDEDPAREAIRMIRAGEADILMKGIINTDSLLHAVLDKELGILPQGRVLTHLSVMQIPTYHKLLFFSDAAVIPNPTKQQHIAMIEYAVQACNSFGIKQPKIALIHFTEKVNSKFPISVNYREIVNESQRFGDVIIDGPIDAKCACDMHSEDVKGISSPLGGDSDVLIFPDIEAANCFYKATTLFAGAAIAGTLQGTSCPVVLPSRSDDGITKYNSLAMACLTM